MGRLRNGLDGVGRLLIRSEIVMLFYWIGIHHAVLLASRETLSFSMLTRKLHFFARALSRLTFDNIMKDSLSHLSRSLTPMNIKHNFSTLDFKRPKFEIGKRDFSTNETSTQQQLERSPPSLERACWQRESWELA